MRFFQKKLFLTLVLAAIILIIVLIAPYTYFTQKSLIAPSPAPSNIVFSTPNPLTSAIPSATPVPTLSPAEREAKYGPCAYVPTLMYHHIQTEDIAKAGNYASLNVN